MSGDLAGCEGARIQRHFIELALEVERAVIASTDEDGVLASRHGVVEGSGNLRLDPAVKMYARLAAFPHKHEVMPRAQGQRRAPDQHFITLVAVAKDQLAHEAGAKSAANAQVLTARRRVAIRAARENEAGNGASFRAKVVTTLGRIDATTSSDVNSRPFNGATL